MTAHWACVSQCAPRLAWWPCRACARCHCQLGELAVELVAFVWAPLLCTVGLCAPVLALPQGRCHMACAGAVRKECHKA